MLPSVAQAQTRPTCPTIDCNSGSFPTWESNCPCTYASGTWTCDIDDRVSAGGVAGAAVVVADFKVTGSTYCDTQVDYAAWGTTQNNVPFFCSRDSTASDPVDAIELLGTDNSDDLCFHGANWDLHNADPTNVTELTAECYGYSSEDKIDGSWSDASDYSEALYGGDAKDDIFGLDGDDSISGEGGNDYADGGPGDDTILGGDGDDTLNGGDDDDSISGNDGEDTINGNAGDDVLCGQGNADTLKGNSGTDILHGGGGFLDDKDGGSPSGFFETDECDQFGTNADCDYPIVSSYSCP